LAAYKTPQDKVACVVRCSQTIMNLLSIASTKSVPAADDFVPVMVFVIIKANPPSLLSTIQVANMDHACFVRFCQSNATFAKDIQNFHKK
jgi:hypothetical protein